MKSAEVKRVLQYFGSRAAGHGAEQGGLEARTPVRVALFC